MKEFNTFPKDIGLKVNVIVRLEFELTLRPQSKPFGYFSICTTEVVDSSHATIDLIVVRCVQTTYVNQVIVLLHKSHPIISLLVQLYLFVINLLF